MKINKNLHPIEASVKKEASGYNIRKVIVALSGGADSVAAAYAAKQAGLEILALNCNFHLRGDESDRDMEFVKKFCLNYQIPLEIKDFNVEDFMQKNKGTSVEMACRELRYQWFREKKEETGAERIITGHNADDNIETLFLNLLRGSGTRGLKGMTKMNREIWRPLLNVHRPEILEYLKLNNLDFVIDSTNLESDYRRNFLRNEVFPLLRSEWKGFDKALDRTIQNLQGENSIIEKVIGELLPDEGMPLPVSMVLESGAPELIIKRFVEPAGPYTTTPLEILSAIRASKPDIKKWKLRNGEAILRNKKLFIKMVHGEGCS